jgi:hypothetical protein
MIIETTETNDLRIVPTKQTIDKPLGIPPPMPNVNSCISVSGGMGTGKTSWLNSVLTNNSKEGRVYYKRFEKVFYMTPKETMSSEENHPFKNHEPSRLYHELTVANLDNIIEQALEEKAEGGNSCLVIDDFSEALKDLKIAKHLQALIFRHRHSHLTVLLSLLHMKALPKNLRSLIDVFVIFKPKSLIEVETMSEEIFGLKKKDLLTLFDYVFDEPYNFLLYKSKVNQFYRNFNRLHLTGRS